MGTAKELLAMELVKQRTPNQLKSDGLHETTLLELGCSVDDLRWPGHPTQMKNQGYSAMELRQAGCSVTELRVAGYTSEEVSRAWYNKEEMQEGRLREFGYHNCWIWKCCGVIMDPFTGDESDYTAMACYDGRRGIPGPCICHLRGTEKAPDRYWNGAV